MNRLYPTLLVAAALSAPAFAQNPGRTLQLKQRDNQLNARPQITQPVSNDRDVVWSSDFSDPNQWTFGTVGGANGSWVIGTNPPGGPPYNIPPIASTTASNGFALYDSNVLNLNGDNAWMATTNPIDLSGYTGIALQFEQFTRALNGTYYVELSTNNTQWTPIEINQGLAANTSTPNPQLYSLNVSNQLGGVETAYIRFRYESPTADYAWMIDDVAIVTLPEHEIKLDYGFLSQFGEGYEYHRVPQAQLGTSVEVGGGVINNGAAPQTNVVLNISLRDANDVEVASKSISVGSIASSDTVQVSEAMTIPSPMELGHYTCSFTLTSDDIASDLNPNNNSAVRYIETTTDLYSIDGIDVIPDDDLVLAATGTNSFTGNTMDVRLLTLYHVTQPTTFTGIEVYLSGSTQPGSYFTASVFDTASLATANSPLDDPLVASEIRIIEAEDMTVRTVGLSFLEPITLQPGAYYVSANLYQEGGSNISLLDDVTVPQPGDASMIWLPFDSQGNGRHIWGNGNAWAVRLSSLLGVGVQQSPALQGVTLYPNPNDGVFEVTMAKSGLTTVEVFNPLGQLVQSSSFNGTTTKLDLSGQAAGIYTVRVGNNGSYNVQRVAVK